MMKDKLNVNQIPALKQAILDLPQKEKNQMLIRLINKDQVLIEQLHFKLLEDEFDLIQRFNDLSSVIKSELEINSKTISKSSTYQRTKLVLRVIRLLSGKINHFAKVTKDVNYELILRTQLLIESSAIFENYLLEESIFGHKLRVYQVTKIKTILKLFDKLHEELKFDYSVSYYEDVEAVVLKYMKSETKLAQIDFTHLKFY